MHYVPSKLGVLQNVSATVICSFQNGLVITLFHYCLIFLSLLRLLALISVLSYLGSSVCLDCPPRYQCIRRVQADPCPQGSYCPGKTGYNAFPCPNGTFGARQFLLSSSECTQCTSGSYCGETGLDKVSGPCKPGMKYPIQLFWLILMMPAAWRIRKSITFFKLLRNLSHTLKCLFFLSLCKFQVLLCKLKVKKAFESM